MHSFFRIHFFLLFFTVLTSLNLQARPPSCRSKFAFQPSSFFEQGEVIRLGGETPNQEPVSYFTGDLNFVFRKGFLPALAWYRAATSDGTHLVELTNAGDLYELEVPAVFIAKLPLGTAAKFKKALRRFALPPLTFSSGEQVRYREPESGQIKVGVYLKHDGEKLFVSAEDGRFVETVSREVFKMTLSEMRPHTPRFRGGSFEDSAPRGETADLLNVVARITSRPDFQGLARLDQLKVIATFFTQILKYQHINTSTVDWSLRACLIGGIAACRHTATLTAMALNETGIPAVTKYEKAKLAGFAWGHAWVETDIMDLRTNQRKTFVIETTRAQVFPLDEVAGSHLPLKEFYLSPTQKILEPQ